MRAIVAGSSTGGAPAAASPAGASRVPAGRLLAALACLIALLAATPAPGGEGAAAAAPPGEGLFAELDTARGRILVRLFPRRAPMTVLNFVTLAEGGSEWTDPRTGRPTRRPLYRDLVFHRVRDFMIQTGDPTGTGRGGSGREFDDEFHPDLRFDRPGMVAMANRGPNTNSSQFFITTRPAPWLNDHHTIFGEVVSGLEVVRSIRQGDRLKGITIIRRGADARAFDAARAHELAKARRAALRRAACKSVPEARAPLDPARVPKPDQPLRSPGSFEFLVIGHNQIRDLPRLGRVFCYDREEALKLARRLVRLARGRGVDFSDLVRRYTDMRHNTRAVNVARSPLDPVALQQIFRLAPGQISDPVDLPGGIYVFRRLD